MKVKLFFSLHQKLMLLIIVFSISLSCSSSSKVICHTKIEDHKVRFVLKNSSTRKKNLSNFYARIDSNSVIIYYSFFSSDIYKTYKNQESVQYILTSKIHPMSPLTKVDSLILMKAASLIDSLGYKNLKKINGATGFNIEVLSEPLDTKFAN